jgi:hypothetical protein
VTCDICLAPGDFISGVHRQFAEFQTLKELAKIPFVAQWEDEGFTRWSVSPRLKDDLLMCERSDGSWWVVGFITPKVETDFGLPTWTAPVP